MPIVIRGEHVNAVVLKYLLEMGYSHTAYLFEKEAQIDVLSPACKMVQPKALTSICEQSLILRSLEIHQDMEESF